VTSEATPTLDPDGTEPEAARAMHIGEVAARTELSLRSLRHWDDVGLLKPSGRSDGGFRLYTEGDVEKILVIRRMKPLGFTLEAMSAAMRDIETVQQAQRESVAVATARERLTWILRDAAERREKLVRHLAMADEFIDLLDQRLE
jgi:DNA-binding transcriptional MerR regulator